MTPPRRCTLTASALIVLAAAVTIAGQAGRLTVERQGDRLRLSAPNLHFLEGSALERLRNGAAVPYVFTVTVEPVHGSGHWARLRQRFVVSYDLWEEKFAVVLDDRARRTATNLTAGAAETWCLDNLAPSVAGMPADKPFSVRLECAVVVDEAPSADDGLSLSKLVDILSRKGATVPPRWELVSAPLRLVDLKDRPQR